MKRKQKTKRYNLWRQVGKKSRRLPISVAGFLRMLIREYVDRMDRGPNLWRNKEY